MPLCFAFAYAGVFASDAKRGACEANLCLPRFRLPYARRLVVVTAALAAVLALQGAALHGALGMSLPSAVLMGLAPALLLGGIAYVLGVITESESTASVLVAVLWVGLQGAGSVVELVRAALLDSAAAMIGIPAAVAADLTRVPVLVAGLTLFALGQALLGRPERRLPK